MVVSITYMYEIAIPIRRKLWCFPGTSMDFPHFIPSQNPLNPPFFLVVKSLNPRIQYFLVVKPFKPHEHGYLLTQLLVSWPLHPTVGDTKRCGWWMAGWELDLRQNGPPKPGKGGTGMMEPAKTPNFVFAGFIIINHHKDSLKWLSSEKQCVLNPLRMCCLNHAVQEKERTWPRCWSGSTCPWLILMGFSSTMGICCDEIGYITHYYYYAQR